MKKTAASILLVSMLAAGLVLPACADDAFKKLGRGISNVFTCPVEFVNQGSKAYESDGAMAACTYGVLKGAGMAVVRALTGVYEIATFFVPVPNEFRPILTDPEFFFQDKLG